MRHDGNGITVKSWLQRRSSARWRPRQALPDRSQVTSRTVAKTLVRLVAARRAMPEMLTHHTPLRARQVQANPHHRPWRLPPSSAAA